MEINKISLKNVFFKNRIVTFIILFLLFKPAFIADNIFFSQLDNYICIFLALLMIVIMFKEKIDGLFFGIIFYLLTLLLSTILHASDLIYYTKIYLPIVGCISYTYLFCKYNYKYAIRNISFFIYIMLFINFISILIGNTTMYERMYFLGYDNSFVPFLGIGMIIITYFHYYIYNKLNIFYWIINILTILSCFLVVSSNATVIGFMIIILDIILLLKLIDKKKLTRVFNLKTYFAISLLFFFLIVVLRLQDQLEFIIVDVLNRDLTFTNRTLIWDKSIMYIKNNFLFGCGVEDFEKRAITKGIFHAHCTYLNILLEGGIISLISFFNIFRMLWNRVKNYINDKLIFILSYGLLLFFIMSSIEYYNKNYLLYMLFIIIGFEIERRGLQNE